MPWELLFLSIKPLVSHEKTLFCWVRQLLKSQNGIWKIDFWYFFYHNVISFYCSAPSTYCSFSRYPFSFYVNKWLLMILTFCKGKCFNIINPNSREIAKVLSPHKKDPCTEEVQKFMKLMWIRKFLEFKQFIFRLKFYWC